MTTTQRIVIVTGAGIGIGAATARAFGALGDHLVVTDILETEGRGTADAIVAAGGSAEFQAYDVRSTEATNRLVADIEARHGRIDVVVANAGVAHRTALGDLTDEKWADIAQDFMDEMGFTEASGRAPAQWVAIRHGPRS